ncbi:PGRS family protein [Sorangium sp. So ce131]|uniref:PGRS family protein n=1 Tax=Sorangium sp. So ce131 TaxID=3133282 RepID=UPI003F60968C
MRRSHWASGCVTILSLAVGLQAIGCFPLDYTEEDASSSAGGGGGGGQPPEPSCVPGPQEGPDASCGVFVSSAAAEGDGTKDKPFTTLGAAVSAAASRSPGARNIYVCVGDLTEKVQLASNGVHIYGSLDCDQGWRIADEGKRTTLSAEADQIPLTIVGGSGAALTHIEDLDVRAQPATQSGGSSIAVVADSAKVEFIRCNLEASDAKQGATIDNFTADAMVGISGGSGDDACLKAPGAGGETEPLRCGTDLVTEGGAGGQGGVNSAGAGSAGTPAGASNTGGAPQPSAGACGPGGSGAPGQEGLPGEGAKSRGQISRTGYTGANGKSGAPGSPGEGGGGGGGSRGGTGVSRCAGLPAAGGAGGGAGGTGGCGGLGGSGGKAGGSSIAVISLASELHFDQVTLIAGKGGNGSAGQYGQSGGTGGLGGKGGSVPEEAPANTDLKPGCNGGDGGKGGDGGDGGGGAGGHSIAIAYRGALTPPAEGQGYTAQTSAPGEGGPGAGAAAGATGQRGVLVSFDE